MVANIAYLKFYLEHGGNPNKQDTVHHKYDICTIECDPCDVV